MKKLFYVLLLIPSMTYSQIDLRGSMGISFTSTPQLTDYLNRHYRTGEELGSFNTAINFSAESDYYFSKNFAGGVELAYTLNSFTFSSELGKRELHYSYIMPSLTAYYMIMGPGYNFKFGGGAGIRLTEIEETFSIYSEKSNLTGIGLLLRADGNTLLSGNLYANIGADLRYDMNGTFKTNIRGEEEIQLHSFSLGIKLGLTYIFI